MTECYKCDKEIDVIWKRGEIYLGIDIHHNPPEFISDFLEEEWSGEYYNLCREHHKELHKEIIKILNEVAKTLKFVNSEYWVCQRMNKGQIREAETKIYLFTKRWVEEKDGNTNTTAK